MADAELRRRREIRRLKILQGSEARLKRITNSYSVKPPDITSATCNEESHSDQERDNSDAAVIHPIKDQTTVTESCSYSNQYELSHGKMYRFNGQFSEGNTFESNGNTHRTSSNDSYTFPKKVSDAEARSFGRTSRDARRNSCTQVMIENFQFYSFSLAVLRPWLTFFTAITLRIYILSINRLPAFETVYFPFIMLELAFSTWSHLESQMFSKPADGSVLSSILLLWGISEALVSKFNSAWNLINFILKDFCIYTFCFVFSHFLCEICL